MQVLFLENGIALFYTLTSSKTRVFWGWISGVVKLGLLVF